MTPSSMKASRRTRGGWPALTWLVLGLVPGSLVGQEPDAFGGDGGPSPWEQAGWEAANAVDVSDFGFMGTVPAVPIGFVGPLWLLVDTSQSGVPDSWTRVTLGGAGLVAGVWALAAVAGGSPPVGSLANGISFDVPLSRSAFEDAYRDRLRERRKSAVMGGALRGTLIGLGVAALYYAFLSSVY